MTDFIATAQVLVTPNTSQFRKQLVQQLQDLKIKPVPVQATPVTKGFATQLRAKLDALKMQSVKVQIEPSFAGFRGKVRDGARAITKDLSVPVKVSGTVSSLEVPQGASVTRAVSAVPSTAETRQREKKTAAQTTEKGITEITKAESEKRIAQYEKEFKKWKEEQEARFRFAKDRERKAAKETAAIFSEVERADKQRSRIAESESFEPRAQFKAAEESVGREEQERIDALKKNSAERERIERSRLEVEKSLRNAQLAAIGAESKADAAQRVFTANKAAATKAQRTFDQAVALGNPGLVKNAELTLKAAAAAKAKSLQDLESAQFGRRLGQASRGAEASAFSFLGLRGATLAASRGFIVGAAGALAFSKALKSATDLQTELNVFAASAGATADQMERVSAAAVQLGADVRLPGVTAGDAARAMSELARAGLSVEDAMAGAVGVLQLSTAAYIDQAKAAQIAASALNAYSLAGSEAEHVADVLANASVAAQGSIEDFGVALSQSAAVARQVGVSLEDTVALLTLLARNGLRGSDAGTSLRTAFLRLVAPTEQAAVAIDRLGLNIRNVQGEVRPDVFAQFGEATKNLSPSLRDAFAELIFGQDAIRAASIGAREGVDGLRTAQATIAEQGTAAELAAARTKGLAGSISSLGSSLSTLGAQTLTPFLDVMEAIVRTTNDAVVAFTTFERVVADFTADAVTDFFSNLKRDVTDLGRGVGWLADRVGIGGITIFGRDEPKTAAELAETLRGMNIDPETIRGSVGNFFQKQIAEAEELQAKFDSLNVSPDLTKDLNKQVEALTKAKDLAQQGVFGGAVELEDPAGDLGKVLEDVKEFRRQLSEQDISTAPIDRFISDIEAKIASFGSVAQRLATLPADSVDTIMGTTSRRVRELLTQLRNDARNLDPTNPLADEARRSVDDIIRQLERLGPEGRAALASAGADLAGALGRSLRAGVSEFTGLDLLPPTLPAEVRSQIERISKLGPDGKAKLRLLGADIEEEIAKGVRERNAVVAAARQAVADAIRAADQAVRDSATTALRNVESFGEQLSSQLAEAIDAGPIGRKVDALTDRLERLRESTQERDVQRGVRDARRELKKARASIVTLGDITPKQQAAIDEFLRPFIEDVQDADARAKEFTLEKNIKEQEDLLAASKKTADEGLERIIRQFKAGKLSSNQFAAALRKQLAPTLRNLPKTNLGLSFTEGFMETFDALVRQANALQGFLSLARKGLDIERPAETKREGDKSVAQAQTSLQDALDAQVATKDNTAEMILVLKKIRDFVDPSKYPKTPATGGRRTPVVGQGSKTPTGQVSD